MMKSPLDWMRWYFEKNRSSYERKVRVETDWSRAHYGEICLLGLNDVIACYGSGEPDLAAFWLEDTRSAILQSKLYLGDQNLDLVGLDRIYVPLAERVEQLLRDGGIDRSSTTPYEAFERYLSSPTDIEPEDFDCVWLIWGLCAILEDQPARYEELLPKLRRKAHRELVRERVLLRGLGALFEESGDEAFWQLYREVLMRWLDPVLETKSEAYLYRDAIRYLLALNWMVHKRHSERRDDFLEVMYGNVSG